MITLLAFLALLGIVQLVLNYYMLRELGEKDGDHNDWWEKLADRWEPAGKLQDAMRYQRGIPSPKDDDK